MSDFIKTIIKWIILGLIVILIIFLLTRLFDRSTTKNKNTNTNNQVVDNNGYEHGDSDYEDGLEPIDEDTNEETVYVDAPDTASKGDIVRLIGVIITGLGIVYLYRSNLIINEN